MPPLVPAELLPELDLTPEEINFNTIASQKDIVILQRLFNGVYQKRKYVLETLGSTKQQLEKLKNQYQYKTTNVFGKLFSRDSANEELQLKIQQTEKECSNQQDLLSNCRINLKVLLTEEQDQLFTKVTRAFERVTQSQKIWEVVSSFANNETKASAKTIIDRKEVTFSKVQFDITPDYPTLYFKNSNGASFHILPPFVCFITEDKFELLDLKEMRFELFPQRFQEGENIPSDSQIIDHTWAKVNKDGSPDLRFSGNYQIPVVKYAKFQIKHSSRLNEEYHISSFSAGEEFGNAFKEYLYSLSGESPISQEFFYVVKSSAEKINRFLKRLQGDNSLKHFLSNINALDGYMSDGPEQGIRTILFLDIVRCFHHIFNIYDFRSKEGFALMYLQGLCLNFELSEYSDIDQLYRLEENFVRIYNTTKDIRDTLKLEDKEFILLSYLLNVYDQDLNEEYLVNLYTFASVIIKADGKVSTKEEQLLKRIKQIPKAVAPEQTEKVPIETHVKVTESNKEESLEEILEELNKLTGLTEVKQEINTLINFIRVQKARESRGLKSTDISYHIIFTGNPGTGKTTVARLVSKIYKALGVIQQGQLVETDRSGLVGEYVGHTAAKVNKVVDSALHGTLFVDEAYALAGDGQSDFGKEAIATLIKRVEDDRDKLVVVLAGYTDEMEKFSATNPGIKSRFSRNIHFSDYSPAELLLIYEGMCTKLEYTLTDPAREKLSVMLHTAYAKRDKSFGNGRYVRNVFEKSLERQANRLSSVTQLNNEVLTTIEAEDIP